MTKPKDGGPAFPFVSHGSIAGHQACDPGMSLRDHFAGLAMQALVTKCGFPVDEDTIDCADLSYKLADAMLAERDKVKE